MLLVYPPHFLNRSREFDIQAPVPLLRLMSVLRKKGYEAELLDMALLEKRGKDSFVEMQKKIVSKDNYLYLNKKKELE